MYPLPFLATARPAADAGLLIADHGPRAAAEAAALADRSRTLGNHIRFCHWREVERLIGMLDARESAGTLH